MNGILGSFVRAEFQDTAPKTEKAEAVDEAEPQPAGPQTES